MTSRHLFSIILKVIGIFFIKDILSLIPSLFSSILYFSDYQNVEQGIWILVLNLLILGLYITVSYCLIFKSDTIIDRLKLDNDNHLETLPINIHRSTILSISIIVIGGLYLAEEIPNLCRISFAYFQESQLVKSSRGNQDFSYVVLSAAKIIIGLLLIGNQKQIVNYIEAKRKI